MAIKIIKNPDENIYNEVTKAVISNERYCPCSLERTSDTLCPCKEFRDQTTEGECHCGRFIKVSE